MNHNFVSYELTELLPKENPYILNRKSLEQQFNNWEKPESFSVLYPYWNDRKYLDFGHLLQYNKKVDSEVHYQHGDFLRSVWTFDDILLWLEEEHKLVIDIITEIDEEGNQLLYTYRIIFLKDLEEGKTFEYYHSRQEARLYAIEECLTLIKNK